MTAHDRQHRVGGLLLLLLSLSVLASCRSDSGNLPLDVPVERPPISYLQDVIPPCTPLEESNQDPCAAPTVSRTGAAHTGTVATGDVQLLDAPPSFDDVLLGRIPGETELVQGLIPHIVVRGTVRPGTARCEDYTLVLANYWTESYRENEGLIYIYCFVDARINEYIVGQGPPELTVSVERAIMSTISDDGGDSTAIQDSWSDLAAAIEAEYRGREAVLFLRTPYTITIEAFVVDGWFDVWFVQRSQESDIRAVARGRHTIHPDGDRSGADLPLTELTQKVQEAAANRIAVTGGRIGTDPSLPLVVSDANDLRSHYTDIGAVYITTETNGEDVEHPTRLPPPAPGDDEPDQPPITTGEEDDESPGTPPVPGRGEEDQGDNTGGGTGP